MTICRTEVSMRVLLTAAITIAAWSGSSPARAYSSFADYLRPVQEGGGAGRLFTGTPADALGCDVCHRGAEGAPLEILGLPEDRYVPGQTYEIRFQWPATAEHVALMAEFTTDSGAPAGITALAPYATWQATEKCENEFPAADVCRVGTEADGCCRDLEMRDACNFPGQRSVFWVLDCGSKSARAVWTAPGPGAGDVWFGTSMVTSNIMNDARGDGATSVRKRLRPVGASEEVSAATGTCQVSNTGSGPRTYGLLTVMFVLAAWLVRRRSLPRE
jgi:MYXO-CTERM domain-containing protein